MSILKQENIMRLLSVSNELKSSTDELNKLVFRSTVLPEIFYEIFSFQTDAYIYVCSIKESSDIEHAERLFCCWANGDIVTDGIWLKELEDCLPSLYQRLCRIYHQIKAENNKYDLKMTLIDNTEIAKLNNKFLTSHLYTQQDLLAFYNSQRYRY